MPSTCGEIQEISGNSYFHYILTSVSCKMHMLDCEIFIHFRNGVKGLLIKYLNSIFLKIIRIYLRLNYSHVN